MIPILSIMDMTFEFCASEYQVKGTVKVEPQNVVVKLRHVSNRLQFHECKKTSGKMRRYQC